MIKIPSYEDKPITEKWISCNNCNRTIKLKYCRESDFGIECAVCGKEGCSECISQDDMFYVVNKGYYRHNTCQWTEELIKLNADAKAKRQKDKSYDSRYELGGEFNCGRDCS